MALGTFAQQAGRQRTQAAGILLQGDKQLQKELLSLPDALFNKVVREATLKATTPMMKDAKAGAAKVKDTGLLRRSIGRKRKVWRRSGVVMAIVGPRTGFKTKVGERRRNPELRALLISLGKDPGELTGVYRDPSNYAHLVEFGTRAHKIPKAFGLFTVNHPGSRPQPFMRPAFDKNQGNTLNILRRMIRAGLDKLARESETRVRAQSRA